MSAALFLAQRLTAVVLTLAVLVHLYVIIQAERAGLTAGAILARTHHNRVFLAFYACFVIAASVHAPIGLRNVLIEWAGLKGRPLDVAMALLALLLLVIGLTAAYAVYAA
ncbi:fumarate reductase subunit C [Rhizobiales bacterium GAS191]|jgi:fumarate reductase subunit C|nr:fumarate reductase subunit C [Rhizobiales bacterium GAS113]SEC64478.1 fumarate reductase subunit C [Rhizobiales bacterium GAS191]